MTASRLRIVSVFVLVAILAFKGAERSTVSLRFDPESVTVLLGKYGIEPWTAPDGAGEGDVLRFQVRDCPAPLTVVAISPSGSDYDRFGDAVKDDQKLFVYADDQLDRFNRWRFIRDRMTTVALSVVGLGDYKPMNRALMILAPPACPLPPIDWAALWRR